MWEILDYQFFQNAILAGILASICAGIVGTYIVIKRMSLVSGSISHSAFGGLGIAYFFGFNPLLGATIFSAGVALVLAWFRRVSGKRIDVLLSFLWSFGMAIGLLFIFLSPGYNMDLMSFLFGNILLVSRADLLYILVLDVVILMVVGVMFKAFLGVLFDEEYSELANIPVNFVYSLLFVLIALSVVAVLRVVGIVLMIALLTISPAIMQRYFYNVTQIMLGSVILNIVSVVAGLVISYQFNLATGPVIILVISVFYLGSLLQYPNFLKFEKNKNTL